MYKRTNLHSGIRFVSHAMPGMQSVALGFWIKVGGRYESSKQKGCAHYLEHLVFKGTKKYSCQKLKEAIEGVGGSMNGFTSEELTCYFVKLPSRYVDQAVDILSDMVVQPLIRPSDVERERTVILEEIKMYKDSPQSYVYDLLDNLLWPKQPLGEAIIGSAESVSRIAQKDLASFRERYYAASNIVISAAGSLKHKSILEKLEDRFKMSPSNYTLAFAKVQEKQDKPQLKLFCKKTEQTHLALGFHSFKRDHPLRYALSLLNIIVGANMSSRLFHELREKRGLAYEIGSLVKRFYDTGAFIVHAGIDNRKVVEAITLILGELNKLKKTLPTSSEFSRAKEFFIGQITLALEDTLDQMLWQGETVATLDTVYSLQDILKEVRRITREDIRRVAKEVFREERLNVALIGPLKGKEEGIYKKLNMH